MCKDRERRDRATNTLCERNGAARRSSKVSRLRRIVSTILLMPPFYNKVKHSVQKLHTEYKYHGASLRSNFILFSYFILPYTSSSIDTTYTIVR